ncbi:hypothetical protein [Streptomyces sp. NPDC050560]|uniref:hypothetical protein n=1 Tax=Streptomyces sp. NPDC050560 TaxID=3365630 RepID=UPI0037A09125
MAATGRTATTGFIGNALLALLRHPDRHPDALRRLREAPERIPGALGESLRYDAPVSVATFRRATAPTGSTSTAKPAGTSPSATASTAASYV